MTIPVSDRTVKLLEKRPRPGIVPEPPLRTREHDRATRPRLREWRVSSVEVESAREMETRVVVGNNIAGLEEYRRPGLNRVREGPPRG